MMDHKEICQLWIEYIKESNFKKENGKAAYIAYINRIEAVSESRRLTPLPTVRKISDIIGLLIDQAHSEAITDEDESFEHFKKRLIYDIKLLEQTSLLLQIHCPGIPPRGGQKAVIQEISTLLKTKLKEIPGVRDFYLTWTEPGERVDREIKLYLDLYRLQKKGHHNNELAIYASNFAKNSSSRRVKTDEPVYIDGSQMSRAIGYARKILRNVEKGHFPGDYR